MRSPTDSQLAATQWMTRVLPDWLVDAVRPQKVPIPWRQMLRSVIAIWVPLTIGIISGDRTIALLPTLGGVMSVMIDQGGPYPARFRRVGAGACGGGIGLAIGMFIHGRGWMTVLALVLVAALSTIISRPGPLGSVAGMQLLVYCTVCLGPLGLLRPWWRPSLGFVAGAIWALLLLVPGWLRTPRVAEANLVATVYHNVATGLRAIGTPDLSARRQAVVNAINAAYDAVPIRPGARRGTRPTIHLLAILNASHLVTEASTALRVAGERPPPWVTDTLDRLADAIGTHPVREQLPAIPPQWSDSPGAVALRESLVRLSRTISGEETLAEAATERPPLAQRLKTQLKIGLEAVVGGWFAWTFTVRLTSCILVASLISEVLPLERSYWVPLTVAVVLKPDFGSVFVRAVQRAIGTIVGAVVGAAILAIVPFGPWLIVPFGILAALLPWGKAANFGLAATFLAPFVVLLIDLIKQTGWSLAADRAIDTVVAATVVLLVGYAPWPVSWHAHLPGKLAETLQQICDYMDESLARTWAAGGRPAQEQPTAPPPRSRLRRQCYRALSDLRIEYQRTLTEPRAVSRRASLLWPAVVALEELLDSVAGTAVAICRGAPAPDPATVHQLTNELRAVAGAITGGLTLPPTSRPLPDDHTLETVTSAVRSVLAVLTPVEVPPDLARKSA